MIFNEKVVKKIIANALELDIKDIDNSCGLARTYNWDSLNHVMILTKIEEYYGIHIDDSMFSKLCTVAEISDFLKQYELINCLSNEPCPCANSCYEELKIHFKNQDGMDLVGIYNKSNKPYKGFVLFTHGIPAEKNESGFHEHMAAYFAQNGFDSFRFDFRFMGESTPGSHRKLTIKSLISDIEDAYLCSIDLLRNSRNRMPDKTFVVGTSCGGGMVLRWINQYNHTDSINAVFLCCPVLDYVYEATGIPKTEIENKTEDIFKSIENNGYITDRDAEYGKDFFVDAMSFDFQKEYLLYKKKLVIYHGTIDQCVPFEMSLSFAKTNPDVDLVVIDNARHGFGGPYEDKTGKSYLPSERAAIKNKNQSEIIHDITCYMRCEDLWQ